MGSVRTILVVAAMLSATVPSVAVAATPPATAASWMPAAVPAPTRIADVDGDGRPDTVFLGTDATGVERVGVRFATGTVQRLTGSQVTGGLKALEFGTVIVGDVNADGYADILLIGRAAGEQSSSVWALWGGSDGIVTGRSKDLVDGIANAYSALAFVPLPERVLMVGAPTEDDAPGSADLYRLAPDGSVTLHRRLAPGTAGVPGSASRGVEFGWTLAASGNLLAVGDPRYGSVGAGSVWVFRMRAGLAFDAVRVSQETRGIPGHSEENDAFGASVSVLGDRVIVGAPGESIGRVGFAGAVTSFRVVWRNGTLTAVAGRQVTQAWPGVPGVVAASHRFGAQVLAVRLCEGVPGALVFASGEQGRWTGREEDSEATMGRVLTVPLTSGRTCPGAAVGTNVPSIYAPLSVARTAPAGSPGEAPVSLTRNPHEVVIGSAGFTVADLTITAVALPAA